MRRAVVLALLLASLVSCTHAASPRTTATAPAKRQSPAAFQVVLIAGDDSIPVFDNAVSSVQRWLQTRVHIPPHDIHRLSASQGLADAQHDIRVSTADNVLDAIATLHPAPGQGCFVFATSHGVKHLGLYLSPEDDALTPQDLDDALQKGCGAAPTVVIVSSCYSGSFARPPMARANRIVLTAALPDRPSFGCGAGREYTVYDRCLLDALPAGGTWHSAYDSIRACVSAEEDREEEFPSEPQAWFGRDVAAMALTGR